MQRFSFQLFIFILVITGHGCAHKSQNNTDVPVATVLTVDAKIALSSLIALSDGHLQKLADDLDIYSKNAKVQSAKWPEIRSGLSEIAQHNIPALIWFALPDGSYWSVDAGQASGNLADRPYWSKVMNGQTVMGDLVVSKATGRNVAIIAVPVRRPDKSVAGVLGASVYLDKLSHQLKQEMGLEDNFVFYAIDSTIKGALNSNTSLIFTNPKEFGPEMSKVFDEMVSRSEGVASYHFQGSKRSVIYQKSPVVNWWYAFGVISK